MKDNLGRALFVFMLNEFSIDINKHYERNLHLDLLQK